jgi:hypothetical protein
MKLDTCLVACDLNGNYTDFVPLVFKLWKNIVKVKVKLVLISEYIPSVLDPFKDDIILFRPIENIPTAFQAQCIRVLYPSLLESKNGIIISDMDLIPLNSDYYNKNIESYSNESFIVYRNVIDEYFQYPICFCAATPNTWKEIFKVESEDDIRHILKYWYSLTTDYSISSANSVGWALDQIMLFKYLSTESAKDKVILLKDEDTGFKRLDRSELKEIKANIMF